VAVCVDASDGGDQRAAAGQVRSMLESLASKHLLQTSGTGDERRYVMLETIHEYALERLNESGETYWCCQNHAQFFLGFVEQAEPELSGPHQQRWLDQLEAEHNNLRAALDWALQADAPDIAQRMAGALWRFWDTRGYLTEGRRWLEDALARGGVPAHIRARALNGAGMLAYSQSDLVTAQMRFEESLALRRALNDQTGIAIALNNLGMVAWSQGNYAAAQQLYEECLAIDRATGDRAGSAYTLGNLGLVLHHQGNYAGAEAYFAESLAIFRAFGNRRQEAFALHNLGMASYHRRDRAEAHRHYQASLAIKQTLGDSWGIASTFVYLAQVTCAEGNLAATRERLERSYSLRHELDDKQGLIEVFEGCAALAVAQRRTENAAVLLGAAQALRQEHGFFHHTADRAECERSIAAARQALPGEAFATAWARGQAMRLEEAQSYALAVLHNDSPA
jgi:non-specific serine/threonine protein kinase